MSAMSAMIEDIEIPTADQKIPSPNEIYDYHQTQLTNGNDNDQHTLPILELIGGIDKILIDYFSYSNVAQLKLNEVQLTKIYNLLLWTSIHDQNKNENKNENKSSNPSKRQNKFHRHQTKRMLSDNINTNLARDYNLNSDEFCYEFYENNNFLHSLNINKKFKSFMDSSIMHCIVGFSCVIYQILVRFPFCTINTMYHPMYSLSFSVGIWIPYLIYLFFTVNKTALHLTMRSFEFWLKTTVCIIHFMSIWLDYFWLQYSEWKYFELALIERILFGLSLTFAVIIISLYDGLNMPRCWKTIITILVAIWATIWSTWSLLVSLSDDDEYHYVNYGLVHISSNPDIAFSLNSIQISTMRIIGIFFWKQSIVSFYRVDRGAFITKTPFIVWNVDVEGQDTDIDEATLLALIRNNENRNGKTLIKILGGIDMILSYYLNDDETIQIQTLNKQQMNKIYHTLKIAKKQQSSANNRENTDTMSIYYFFDETDTFLHYFCDAVIANKIILVLHSKIVHFLVFLFIIAYMVIKFMDSYDLLIINILISFGVLIPYPIFVLLSSNTICMREIFKTFEFWFKLCYAVIFVVAVCIDKLIINKPNKYYNTNSTSLIIIDEISLSIWFIVATICVGCVDAIKAKRIWKIIFLSIYSFLLVLFTSYLMFIVMADQQRRDSSVFVISSSGMAVSLLSLQVSVLRVISLFFCKQLYSVWFRKNRASLLKYIVHIRWYKQSISQSHSTQMATVPAINYNDDKV